MHISNNYHSTPVHRVIMFPYQQTQFYSENQNMGPQYWQPEHWPCQQNQYLIPYQAVNSHFHRNYYQDETQDVIQCETQTLLPNSIQNGVQESYYYNVSPNHQEYCQVAQTTLNDNQQTVLSVSTTDLFQYTPPTPEPPVQFPVYQLPQPNSNCIMAKKHRAQISLVPTSSGNFKAIVKRKRKRTVFTTEQIEALENIFKTRQYISRDDRQQIVQQLQLSDKSVKIWFQNRRLKGKKNPDHGQDSVDERSSPDSTRLDSAESQIIEKTNECGNVTLDDEVMGNLVNVIDDFLTNTNTDVSMSSNIGNNTDCPIYEPVSPASISDNYEVISPFWKPAEPNESLQRLFDLQTMLSL